MIRVLVVYYSAAGRTKALAMAVAEGAASTGAATTVKRVTGLGLKTPTTAQDDDIPIVDPVELVDYDAIIVGSPTRFGRLCAPIAHFLDQTTTLWKEGKLIGKVGGAFTSTASQHGGSDSTIFSILTSMMHHGIITVGLPYSFKGLLDMSEPTGGSPYGATTVEGPDDKRYPSDVELAGARYQGAHTAKVALALSAGSSSIGGIHFI